MDQVQITSGSDLAHLDELDQKLWVALACPVEGLAIDVRTLQLIDADKDNRIRAQELIAAAKWVTSLLRDPESLVRSNPALSIDNINSESPEGKELVEAARALLAASGKADEGQLHVDDVATAVAAFDKQAFNGDGIVPPGSVSDEADKATLSLIVANTDAPLDRSGIAGVSQASLDGFFAEVDAYVSWLDAGTDSAILPLGADTAGAFAALSAVREKVDDYFGRTRIAAFDPRALTALNRAETEYTEVGSGSIGGSGEQIAHFPLSHVEAGKALSLAPASINPAWSARIEALVKSVLTPLLGAREQLTFSDWEAVVARFAGYEAWLGQKPGSKVATLDEATARGLKDAKLRERLAQLIAADEAERPKATVLEKVERLAYLHRDLFRLANNFVSFRAFYARSERASFQDGTLFIDQRECELVLRVNDPAKHSVLASLSKCYLMYCDIKNAKGESRQIVAALTNGSADNITAGRNGIFYDRDGNDWDATITKVVDSPISVRAAFWAPYKKVLRSVEEFVTKRAAAAEAESDKLVGGAISSAESAVDGAPKPVKPAKLDIGVVAALGVAVGGITAALGALMQAFFGLGIWMPLGVLGLILVISGPSMAIAWLKLRQRNIAPLLDANGWAVNTDAKLNVRFGEALTKTASLPKGATRDLADPFAEKPKPWGFYLFLFVVLALGIAWYLGKLDSYLPPKVRSTEVLGEAAPANVKVQEEAAAPAEAPAEAPAP